jgi:hypothetical protein
VPGSTYLTDPTSINPTGEITGDYVAAIGGQHGFLRARDGTFTTFDPPDATLTSPASINPAGEITGYYYNGLHGFVRARDGTFITFDPPGSIQTYPTSINPAGEITGHYYYVNLGNAHGFLCSSR